MKRSPACWSVQAVTGQTLDWWIQEYLGEASVVCEENQTVISAEMEDLAAVYGFILRLRDVDIHLESLHVFRKINY